VRAQTQQAGGADRLTARLQPADDYTNGFFSVAIFDNHTKTPRCPRHQPQNPAQTTKTPRPQIIKDCGRGAVCFGSHKLHFVKLAANLGHKFGNLHQAGDFY
jgi:hypothetical protein